MLVIKIVALSLGSIALLFILTKIIGTREMSQLSMFDYINSITIGSIAAEMATSLEDNFLEPLIAMIVYALVIILLVFISNKSVKLRRIINGKTVVLLSDGELYKDNFKRARLDICEFLTECRVQGFFNLADIEVALLEPNGKLSILPKENKRPAIPEDFNLNPEQEKTVSNVILDGKILYKNLKALGKNQKWLENKLKEQKVKSVKNIFLATCDKDELSVYEVVKRENLHDIFV